MKRTLNRARYSALMFACALAALLTSVSLAQSQQKPPLPPPPPDHGESSSKTPPPTSTTSAPPPIAQDSVANDAPLPSFDVLAAQKDIEVGSYYMRRGDYDAAIDRFKDATQNQPKYAEPWRLLGEAYDKKRELPEAINAYEQYIKLYPHAPTRKKIEDHISDMQSKLQKQSQKQPAGK